MRTRFLLLMAASAVACGDGRAGDRDPAPRDGGTAQRDAGAIARDGGTGARDGGTQDPEACPPGATLHYYSLSPISPVPPVSSLDFPALPQNASVRSAGNGNEHSVRLDFCEVGGTQTLARVLYLGESFDVPRRYVRDDSVAAPTEEIVDTELGTVIEHRLPASHFLVELGDEPQDLRIRLVGDSGLLFVGHPRFVAVARGNVTASSIVYTSSTILVGDLGPGDVFGELDCQFGESPMSKTFVMDTATFEVDACTFLGGGFTSGYRITNLAITDTNPALSAEEQQRVVFDGEEAVEAVMTYQWNHHNACDSFHLALPHADYAASTSPAAGCGGTVPNAPEREFDENPILPVLFRIRYHGGAWTDGSMPGCNHYLFCN